MYNYPFPIRKIIHVDMDAFYASVEQLDNPDLQGKPLAVGGMGNRGVVAAASYEARKFGVHSAMSSRVARELCPNLIFVPTRFGRYREISNKIRSIFFEYTDLVEPLSLDEAYLDVTENYRNISSASRIAREIREKIKSTIGLTASAGISINKFMAKTASDINKPDGQKTISPDEVLSFLESLDVKKFYGVGKVTRQKMYRFGIYTGKDLKNQTKEFLENNFGKSGLHYHQIVRGIQYSSVRPYRLQKSLAAEHTFSENISSEIYMMEHLNEIADSVENRLQVRNLAGKTVTLKIRYRDFSLQTRSKTVNDYLATKAEFLPVVEELLYREKMKDSVRLLGISISNLNNVKKQSEDLPINSSIQLNLEF